MNAIIHRTAIALAVAGMVGTGAFALAQGTPPPPPQHQGGRMMMQGRGGGPGGRMMLGRLNLTDQQRSQIQTLQQQQRASHQALMQKMGDLQKQLRDAVFADNGPNEAQIANLQQQIAQLEPQLQQARLQMQEGISRILTPDQRKQLREMAPPGRGGRGMGGQMRHGGWF